MFEQNVQQVNTGPAPRRMTKKLAGNPFEQNIQAAATQSEVAPKAAPKKLANNPFEQNLQQQT